MPKSNKLESLHHWVTPTLSTRSPSLSRGPKNSCQIISKPHFHLSKWPNQSQALRQSTPPPSAQSPEFLSPKMSPSVQSLPAHDPKSFVSLPPEVSFLLEEPFLRSFVGYPLAKTAPIQERLLTLKSSPDTQHNLQTTHHQKRSDSCLFSTSQVCCQSRTNIQIVFGPPTSE